MWCLKGYRFEQVAPYFAGEHLSFLGSYPQALLFELEALPYLHLPLVVAGQVPQEPDTGAQQEQVVEQAGLQEP